MILDLLLLPFVAPVQGALWVIEQINNKVIAELNDPDTLKNKLLQLQISLERGGITQEEYIKQAGEVWKRLSDLNSLDAGGDQDSITTDTE